MIRYCVTMLLSLFCLIPLTTLASDSIPFHLSVLIDAEGKFLLEDVTDQTFTPLTKNSFSAGYTSKVHWFKVEITPSERLNSEHHADHIVLEVHPTYLDYLWFYDQNRDGQWVEHKMGDHYPFSDRSLKYRSFALELPNEASNSPIYIRLQTTSSSVFNLNIWDSFQTFQETKTTEYLIIGLYYGILGLLLIINAGITFFSKDKIFILYLFYLLTSLSLTLGTNGIWAEFIFPSQPEIANYLTMISNGLVFIAGSIFYERVMLISRTDTPLLYWINKTFLIISGMIIVSLIFGYFTDWMVIAMNSMMIMLIIWLIRAWRIWRNGQASFWLLIAHIMTLMGGMVVSLSLNGIINGDFWFINGFQIGTLGTILALEVVMIQRVYQIYQSNLQATSKAELAEKHRQQQDSFLSMLTHELKTPLSIINMVLISPNASERIKQHAITSVKDICDIVDHCSESQRLKHQHYQLSLRKINLVDMIQQQLLYRPIHQTVEWRVNTDMAWLETDETYLRVIINNLITNASKYAKPDTPIVIEVNQDENKLCFKVQNYIIERYLPDADKLYDPYYRSPSAKKVSGSGLGLFIVKSLVERLSGNITYEVISNNFVSFTVTLEKNNKLHKKL